MTDAQVRDLAAEILKRSEYARWRSALWIERALAWLTHLSENRPPLYWIILGALLLVALVLIVHVTIAIRVALAVPARTVVWMAADAPESTQPEDIGHPSCWAAELANQWDRRL